MATYTATHEGQTATFTTRREVAFAVFAQQTFADGSAEPWGAAHWVKNLRAARQFPNRRDIPGGGVVRFAIAKAQAI